MTQPLVIFDFDGTLANTFEFGIKISNSYAKRYNYDELHDMNIVREVSGVKYIFSTIPWYYIPIWAYRVKKDIIHYQYEIQLFPNISEEIIKLSKIADLGIISGSKPTYINTILKNHKIDHYFKFIIGNKGTRKHSKITKFKSDYNTIIYIGDDIEDIKAANKSKVKSIAVEWGSSSKKILSPFQPNKIISSADLIYKSVKDLL